MSKDEQEMIEIIKFLQNQVFTLREKTQSQANEIEKYRVALSKIEEVIHEI